MKRFLWLSLVSICFAAAGCSQGGKESSPASVVKVREGVQAPDATLVDPAGKKVTLSSLRGKVVFLNFWATWCPPCREEMPSMIRLNKAMEGAPFQMVAVTIDEGGMPTVEAFFKKTGFSFPVFIDPTQEVGKLFGITGVPETFILDKKGVIVKKVVGGLDWSSPESLEFFKKLAAQ